MPISRHIVFYITTQDYLYRLLHNFSSKIVFKLVHKNFLTQNTNIETTELNSENSMIAAVRNNSYR